MPEPSYRLSLASLLEANAGLRFTDEQRGVVNDVLQELCYDRRDLVAFLSLVDIALIDLSGVLKTTIVQDHTGKNGTLWDALKETHPGS